jgi:hypothetical protein
MRRLLAPALSILLLALLAACESSSGGMLRGSASDGTLESPLRCTHCGWIESKQEIGADVAHPHAPAIYEYTVRMANGSLRVFRQESSVRWRVGEQLILFAGAAD